MNKFSKFIVEHKALMLSIFAGLLIVSVLGFFFLNVNSDVTSYLPDDTMTIQGKEELSKSFDIMGESSIVVTGLEEDDIRDIAGYLEGNELTTRIAWIGSFDDLLVAIDQQEPGSIKDSLEESYRKVEAKYVKTNKDGSTSYVIGIYLEKYNTEDEVIDFVNEIYDFIGEKTGAVQGASFALGGGAENAKNLLESSIGEIPYYLIAAVILITIVLLITTKSWYEPLIFLLVLGLSILINMGSNALLPQISTITLSSSTILQLALAMDYSIFLMHAYYDEKALPGVDTKTALRRALPKTVKAITASALTTIGGFVALFAMRFGMGFDLGMVLAKGVALSLITVVFLQPVIILIMNKKLERSQHKCFQPKLKKVGGFASKHHKVIIAIAAILAIPVAYGSFQVSLAYLTMTDPIKNPNTSQVIVQELSNQLIVIAPDKGSDEEGNTLWNSTDFSVHYSFVNDLSKIENVANPLSVYNLIDRDVYVGAMLTQDPFITTLRNQLVQNGYALYTIDITADVESEESFKAVQEIMAAGNHRFGEGTFYVTGLAQGASDLAAVTPTDFVIVNLLSIAIIFLVLLFTFRSFSLSAILVFVIQMGIWINLTLVSIIGSSINFMSYIIISAIQMGATVDYAILVTSKYQLAKKQGELDEIEAIKQGVKHGSTTVLLSATILILCCLCVFFITSNVIVSEITMLIASGATLSTILVMTLLPAILTLKSRIRDKIAAKKMLAAGVTPNTNIDADLGLVKCVDADVINESGTQTVETSTSDNANNVDVKVDIESAIEIFDGGENAVPTDETAANAAKADETGTQSQKEEIESGTDGTTEPKKSKKTKKK